MSVVAYPGALYIFHFYWKKTCCGHNYLSVLSLSSSIANSFGFEFNCFLYLSPNELCCGESDSQDAWTALMCAAQLGHADCVRLLLDSGADTEAKNHVRPRSFID